MPGRSEREKRKHARVSHTGTVEFITDGRRLSGRSVNVSRSGMQVEVRLPDSFESVRRVTFTLPTSDTAISVPFRVVRSDAGEAADKVGLEFDFENEAQELLIEQFIRDMMQRADSDAAAEMRRVPRTDCEITDVTSNRADITVHSIDNVSTEGLLLTFDGPLGPGDELELRAVLPDDGRKLKLRGRVVYVIGDELGGSPVAGMRLEPGSEVFEARLRNFISERRSTDALRNVYDSFAGAADGASEYRIDDPEEIRRLLSEAERRKAIINTLSERTLRLLEHHIGELDEASGAAVLAPAGEDITDGGGLPVAAAQPGTTRTGGPRTGGASGAADPGITDAGQVYAAFALDGGSYLFKTAGRDYGTDGMRLELPEVVYRSEKRSSHRRGLEGPETVRLWLPPGGERSQTVSGRIVDVSRRGFLCEVEIPDTARESFTVGQTVFYDIDTRYGLSDHGQIRHATVSGERDGGTVLQLGIEAGVSRSSYAYRRIEPAEWDTDPVPAATVGVSLDSVPVRYRNRDDQEIAALLNATRFHVEAPVVIVPPAFGKKKETLAPFVATLLTNFARAGQDVVTVRYDGINRPGDSFNEVEDPPRGYEMLRYRLSQGLYDLRTTLDYVEHNPYFTPTKVVLFTASMSSIDARKLLSTTDRDRVSLWVSLMGVPAAQATIGNILAGTDIIGNYRLGIPNGVRGMLGHLIDMDTLARDLIEEKYAYLTDARVDMSTVSTPVLWIVGRHDHWVDPDQVADLMAVDGGGPRELIDIPTGHNLRNSEDAIRTFKLITSHIYRHLTGERMEPLDPPKDAVLDMVAAERERTAVRRPPALEEYWRDYLLGASGQSEGYDFYRNLADFREFLATEAELVAPREGDRIADLGCGTGLFIEALLEHIAGRRGDSGQGPAISITAVDLVPDALERAREKSEAVIRRHPGLAKVSIEYVNRDLEPNRLLPIRRLVESRGRSIRELRNRVEGLSAAVVDRLAEHDGAELAGMLAGEHVEETARTRLSANLPEAMLPVVLDLNRAARFVRGRIRPEDISPGRRSRATDAGAARSGDLLFDVLDFGDWAIHENTGFPDASFDKIVASLFLSYLFNPDDAMAEFYRMLAPGGRLLVSTMRPDSDVSTIFTDYVEEVRSHAEAGGDLDSAQAMLNEAAALFELEEDGLFRFYTGDELAAMFEAAGFVGITVKRSLGSPPQAIIVTGEKPR